MIPALLAPSSTEQLYIEFFNSLKSRGFTGEISHQYGERSVLSTDNSIYQLLPQGVVYPRDTDDLIKLCELASEKSFHDIVLAARGGGTGTNAQSLTDGVVVDISRHMNQILEVNSDEHWVRVQAGVVKDQLNAELKKHGLFFAPELSTSNRATIGGMINTDASGQGSCVYGKTRDHVLALKTVLADGSVLNTHALNEEAFEVHAEPQTRAGLIHRVLDSIARENSQAIEAGFPKLNRCLTGYDLAHIRDENGCLNLNNILCGSEGTLGFISEAKLNVLSIPKCTALIVVKYADFEASLRDASELMAAGPTSIETIDSKVLNLAMNDFIWSQVEEFFSDETAVPVKGINLVEYSADSENDLAELMQTLINQLQKNQADDGSRRIGYSVARGHEAVNKIWAMRKRAVGLLGNAEGEARPVPFVEDTAVPPEHLADFIMEFREILDGYDLQYGMFGHVDAGVLHVRPALDMKDPAQEQIAWEISDRIADLTHQYHGLLWGEHGKGVRSEYAPKFFGDLYPLLQRVKAVFDPHNQLNPGKIATPDAETALLKIDEVPTRGQSDRIISVQNWNSFEEAVYCNGNGACYNWNFYDAMCPSWKATRKRAYSPKGRASLVREWLTLLSKQDVDLNKEKLQLGPFKQLNQILGRVKNSILSHNKSKDFSNEVYDAMSTCLACKSCTGQCPIKVDVPEFRSKFLAFYHTRYLRPLKDHMVGSLENLLPIAAKFPWAYNFVMKLKPIKWLLDRGIGFVDAPLLSKNSLAHLQIPIAKANILKNLDQSEKDRCVIIVQDAFTRYFEAPFVADVVVLLRKLGYLPMLAPFYANGKPLHVHGFLNKFKKVATKTSQALNALAEQGIPLIGLDPSMTLCYRGEYPKHIDSSCEAPPVQLLQEWLVGQEEVLREHAIANKRQYTLALHCTEKTNANASAKQWQRIFSALGQELKIAELGCCGMAGTFGHESRNRQLSSDIYDLSWRSTLEKTEQSEYFLATGYSCRSQVKREQSLHLQHPLSALLKLYS
jgi:FAD/FMN-containing dehydrogenase/Fe-S oxidoreductase